MPFLRGLIAILVVGVAGSAAAVSPEKSPGLARKALDARLDEPQPVRHERPTLFLQHEATDLRERVIGLLPGETLESVARTLAQRRVEVELSSDRAFVTVRLPLG